jgi:hypothetical protein
VEGIKFYKHFGVRIDPWEGGDYEDGTLGCRKRLIMHEQSLIFISTNGRKVSAESRALNLA